MTDLSYDLAAIQSLGSELLTIADVMNGNSAVVQYDEPDVGHERVHSALEEFADNWDDKREQLTASLTAVGGMALQAAEVLKEADDALAAEVRKIMER